MKEKLTIVKVGGSILENEEILSEFLDAFKQLSGKKILIHGGGKIASQLAVELGLEVKMVQGRRITDDDMIEVVINAYSGLNKKLTALLQDKKVACVGLTGADGNTIKSIKRPITNGVDYGWVGDVQKVNVQLVNSLLFSQMVPIMAPLTHDGSGQLLNTNADTIASELAVALSDDFEVTLNFIFDQLGVMRDLKDPDSLIKSVSYADYQILKSEKVVADGMIPKLDNAFTTIEKGVKEIRLLNTKALFQLNNPEFDEFTAIH